MAKIKDEKQYRAVMLGMTAARLNAILGGKANPTFEQARIISSRLNIPAAIVLA